MELLRYLGFVFGGTFGIILIIGSTSALATNPPDYVGFFVLVFLGVVLLLIAAASWEVEFGKKDSRC